MRTAGLIRFVFVFSTICSAVVAYGQNVTITDYKVNILDQNGETFDGVFKPNANTNVAVQDGLTTYNGYQYAGYFNSDHRLCLARRLVTQKNWQKIIFTDYLKTSTDSHNGISLGICANDGTIHIAFDHHANALKYKVSVPDLVNNPGAFTWDENLFSPVRNYLIEGQALSLLTYPRFVPTPDGNLQFYYRHNYPGNGDCRIVFYDGVTSTWNTNEIFISKAGVYFNQTTGNSNSRSQYHNHIMFDDQGTLHTTFTWREVNQGSGTQYNHDIGYLFSEDGGVTWMSNNYTKVADVNTGLKATYFSPGIVVANIAPEMQMINDQAHSVDRKGRVHVIVNHRDTPAATPGIFGAGFYKHHYRNALGVWKVSMLPFQGARPKMLSDAQGNLFLLYIFQGKLHIITASPADDYVKWSLIFQETIPAASFIMDTHRLYNHGEISILTQQAPAVLGDPTPIYVVDFKLEYSEDCYKNNTPCEQTTVNLSPTDDASVRGGQYADVNYGSENQLAVKKAAVNTQNHLETFLRFNINELKGKSKILNAKLRLHVKNYSGQGVINTQQELHYCESNFWTEIMLKYNSPLKPAFTELIDVQQGSTTFVEWDLTNLLQAQVLNESWLTLAIAEMNNTNGFITFHSKESGNASKRPQLIVTLAKNYITPLDDTYARGGVHAGASHGSEIEVVIKDDGNDSFDRIAFLKFDVSDYAGQPVERVFLQMQRKAMSSAAPTTPFAAHFVADDNWEEQSLNWNNKPEYEAAALSGEFGRGMMDWDVTDAFMDEANGDGVLSLALKSNRLGSLRNINLFSKNENNATRHPKLIIRYSSTSPTAQIASPYISQNSWPNNPELAVFPNPADDDFTTLLQNEISGIATLYSISGAVVKQLNLTAASQFIIQVNDLQPGIYLLRIEDLENNKVLTEKVVKR